MKLLDFKKNNGGGIAVIIYGITLILVFTFIAINIANAKVIENGYNSLRDAVQAASSGAVMHLLTSNRTDESGNNSQLTQTQQTAVSSYDIYLQLALGYVINRAPETPSKQSTMVVQNGETNNFIKLDHQKVINSTLALLNDSIIKESDIHDVDKYKILMMFIEPEYDGNYNKHFNIIVYGNSDGPDRGNIYQVTRASNLKDTYQNLQEMLKIIVNKNDPLGNGSNYGISKTFSINLNARGENEEELIRKMETMPYYMIVVKDFALPTLFDGVDTRIDDSVNKGIFKSPFSKTLKKGFTDISGDGHLTTPMCALNSGKTERKLEGLKR